MNIINEFRGLTRQYQTLDGFLKTTTYCDMGAANYSTPSGTTFSVIASQTAMTNHYEATLLERTGEVRDELKNFLPRLEILKTSPVYPDQGFTSIDIPHRMVAGWFLEVGNPVIDGEEQKAGAFKQMLISDIHKKGVIPAIAYYCPNTLVHGFMATLLKDLSVNHNSSTGLIESSTIQAKNITPVMNAGVSKDVILESSKGSKIVGLTDKKLSSSALGHIPINNSLYLTAEEIILTARINYKGIRRLPLPIEMREMLCDLANYQVGSLLSEEIEIRRDTTLYPVDDLYYNDMDELTDRLQKSLVVCRELGFINPDLVLNFNVEVKEGKSN